MFSIGAVFLHMRIIILKSTGNLSINTAFYLTRGR
jgi:hypothetical protein